MKRYTILLICAIAHGACSSQSMTAETFEPVGWLDGDTSCRDFDPCTDESFTINGCVRTRAENGSACVDADDRIGECRKSGCVVTVSGTDMVSCEPASTGCHGTDPYVVRDIDGACVQEWCNRDAPGRTLRPKAAGSPCVKRKGPGVPEFVTGQCSPCGECF